MTKRRVETLTAIALCLVSGACRPAARQPSDASRVAVVVGIPPLAYLVERVGGAHVQVSVLIEPGRSPHSFDPTPKQMVGISRARLFFAAGMPFERRLLPRIADAANSIEIIDTSAGIERRRMAPSREAIHEHDHEAGSADPHIWLDPRLAKAQARHICDALQRVDPANAETYRSNLRALSADLDALDARLRAALAPFKGERILVFHPAYGYFTDAYGLRQLPVEIEGKSPGGKALAALTEQAKAEHVSVLFVQPQHSSRSAAAIAEEIGAKLATLDPLSRDYIANMESMAAAIQAALKDRER